MSKEGSYGTAAEALSFFLTSLHFTFNSAESVTMSDPPMSVLHLSISVQSFTTLIRLGVIVNRVYA